MGWFALWMAIVFVMGVFAYLADERGLFWAMCAVMGGLLAMRVVVIADLSPLFAAAIWVAVAMTLLSLERYGMTALAALSAACYVFHIWGAPYAYLAADIFGVLMLLTAGVNLHGTFTGYDNRNSQGVGVAGPFGVVCGHRVLCDSILDEEAQKLDRRHV